jgi:hypothetical protein
VSGCGGKLPPELPGGPEREEAGHRDHVGAIPRAAAADGDRWLHNFQRGHGGSVQWQPSTVRECSERELRLGVPCRELDGA